MREKGEYLFEKSHRVKVPDGGHLNLSTDVKQSLQQRVRTTIPKRLMYDTHGQKLLDPFSLLVSVTYLKISKVSACSPVVVNLSENKHDSNT